jgi:hypothetical protein
MEAGYFAYKNDETRSIIHFEFQWGLTFVQQGIESPSLWLNLPLFCHRLFRYFVHLHLK